MSDSRFCLTLLRYASAIYKFKFQNGYERLLLKEQNLAEKLREFPALFDKSTTGHKEKDVKQSPWEKVAERLGFTEEVDNGIIVIIIWYF